MYRTINDFAEDWLLESKLTHKIFAAVDESRKRERLNDQGRSLERLAWHITQTLTEMPHKAGLLETDVLEGQPVPESLEQITGIYERFSHTLLEKIRERWTDKSLEEEVNMYGFSWSRGKILSILLHHQIHHRGQMTAIMRALGMKVPGIYGPAKEEWSQMGMAAMD